MVDFAYPGSRVGKELAVGANALFAHPFADLYELRNTVEGT